MYLAGLNNPHVAQMKNHIQSHKKVAVQCTHEVDQWRQS